MGNRSNLEIKTIFSFKLRVTSTVTMATSVGTTTGAIINKTINDVNVSWTNLLTIG